MYVAHANIYLFSYHIIIFAVSWDHLSQNKSAMKNDEYVFFNTTWKQRRSVPVNTLTIYLYHYFHNIHNLVGEDHSRTVTLHTESVLFCLSGSRRSVKYLAVNGHGRFVFSSRACRKCAIPYLEFINIWLYRLAQHCTELYGDIHSCTELYRVVPSLPSCTELYIVVQNCI